VQTGWILRLNTRRVLQKCRRLEGHLDAPISGRSRPRSSRAATPHGRLMVRGRRNRWRQSPAALPFSDSNVIITGTEPALSWGAEVTIKPDLVSEPAMSVSSETAQPMARLRKGARPSGTDRQEHRVVAGAGESLEREADLTSLGDALAQQGGLVLTPPDLVDTDPRPDLAGDHESWTRVLNQAARRDRDKPRGVFAALFYVRGCGARLAVHGTMGWRIERGEMTPDEWAQSRAEVLLPRWSAIRQVLAEAQVELLRTQRANRGRESVSAASMPATSTNGAKPVHPEYAHGVAVHG